jgi:hypothetical protein
MVYKKLVISSPTLVMLLLPLTLSSIPYKAIAQPSSTSTTGDMLTYTNTDYGFTIKYPSDWLINDKDIRGIGFLLEPPDTGGKILVSISNLKPNETGLSLDFLARHTLSGRILELNTNTYFLSGHPAARVIEIQNFGTPQTPLADTKLMELFTVVGSRMYTVTYMATPPERFPNHLQTAQTVIDSFQIINKQ